MTQPPPDKAPRPRPRPLDDRLTEKAPREMDFDPTVPLAEGLAPMTLDRNDEAVVAALGALMVRHVARFGQSRLLLRTVEETIARMTRSIDPQHMMQLEVEAYAMTDWLVGGPPQTPVAAEQVARRMGDTILYDPNASIPDILLRAIDEAFDVRIDYFSRSRGEMNTRRVTPMRIDAEVYLVGWCHARRATRNFRINRITRCVPIHGAPRETPRQLAADQSTAEPAAEGPRQISLLDDDPTTP